MNVGTAPVRDNSRVSMTAMCLTMLTRPGEAGTEVLLGRKKTGLGTGKFVGLGGHLEPGETAVAAAVREVAEESGLVVAPDDLRPVGFVVHRFATRPQWNQSVTVFTGDRFTGEAVETEEIAPRWFPLDALPLDSMWDDARHWLPTVLAGRPVRAEFTFGADCDTVSDGEVTEVDTLD